MGAFALWLTGNVACGADRLHCSLNRVLPSAGGAAHGIRRQFFGKHMICEHVPSDRIVASGVCRTDNLHNSFNRVRPPQESGINSAVLSIKYII